MIYCAGMDEGCKSGGKEKIMTKAYIYEDYLETQKHLTFEQMAELHQELVREVGADEEAFEFYNGLLVAAAKYANTRALWSTMSREMKMEKDGNRISQHTSFITNLTMLARHLKTQGKPAAWSYELGCDTDGTGRKPEGYERKALGDFACYLAFISGINAR
ncbi:MAG: hypothetical protein LUG93_05570 [Lachnospiraceae bacterium]|nr:hypothetical protein [Lachnospiraceae bacterium]